MDIQGWLQHTADRAPPVPSDDFALAFGRPIQGIEATTAIPRRRTRKRAASDSSIIAPQRRSDRQGKADHRPANAARDRPVEAIVSRSNSASRHPRSASQEHVTEDRAKRPGAKTYERRARHKTKPDRYNPQKQKVRAGKQRDNVGEQKTKGKRSRVHRGGDGKRTEKLVQGFQLKNKSSKTRLTLNPDTAVGMFKHGRTSAQVAGRRDGLPDLAFNELKFLRNHNEHQDEHQSDAIDHEHSHQKKKREAEREEISTYFNQRKFDDEAPHSSPKRPRAPKRRRVPDQDDSSSAQGGGSSPILPEEELTAKPYLGFGSRGTVNQSSHPQPSGTTYFTWSESEAESDMRANHILNHKPDQDLDRLSTPRVLDNHSRKRQQEFRPTIDTARKVIQENPLSVQHGQWSASRRIRGPAKVEVYAQRNNARHDPSAATQEPHDSTSMSLPTRPLADSTRVQHHGRQQKRQVLPSDAESFHTSDILKIRGRLSALADQPQFDMHHTDTPHSNKENVQPVSTSPIAKMLRTAHQAISRTHEEPIRQSSRRSDYVYTNLHETEPGISSHLHAFQSQLPRLYSKMSADEKATRQPLHPPSSIQEQYFNQQVRRDNRFEAPNAAAHAEDEEMLDNAVTFQAEFESPDEVRSGQVFAYAPPPAYSNMHSISHRYDRPPTRGVSWSRGGMSNALRESISRDATADQTMPREEDHFDGVTFDDGLEGFWRPNRLY